MTTTLTEGKVRGGFREDQIGENLTYCGLLWASEQVEINLATATDLRALGARKIYVWE